MQSSDTQTFQEVLRVGVVTVSDRASRGEYEDLSGPAIVDWLEKGLRSPFEPELRIVPDERDQISEALKELADGGTHLILTTGGTGPAKRDVTPEATLDVADKELPGFGEKMRMISLQYVPTAILSRQVGAIRGQTLIVNLPGQPKAIGEILDELMASIPYCIQLLEGPYVETNPDVVEAFRPKSARR